MRLLVALMAVVLLALGGARLVDATIIERPCHIDLWPWPSRVCVIDPDHITRSTP